MIDKRCPVCKTALKKTEESSVKCIACEAVISEHVPWESKFGYDWIKELKEAEDAQS